MIVIAEFGDADVPAAIALCAEALDLDEDASEAAAIVHRLREPEPAGRTVAFLARLSADAPPLGVVFGSVSERDTEVGHVDLIAVHPDARRQGIARRLLGAAENALAALGVTEILLAGNPPYYVWPGIDVRYTPAVCAAMAFGYEQDRTAWNMTADLSPGAPAVRDTAAAEARLAEAGIEVRAATTEDLPALVAFAQDTFAGTWGAEITHSLNRPAGGCHLAVRGTRILGFAAYGASRPGWFGPTGTAPDAQGLGIGGVLLRRCLRDLRDRGYPTAQIGWVGPIPFYSSAVAARIERVFFLYRKQL